MPDGWRRIKTLHGLGKRRGRLHRYTVVRWIVAVAATVGIALLPWTGVLRLDLWGGRHLWLGREVGLVEGMRRFAFPFLAVNIAIILASRFVGRYLCGFACPVGALARLDEWFRFRLRAKRMLRSLSDLLMLALCAALSFAAFSFWTDVRVLWRGSPATSALAWTALAGTAAALYVTTHGLGLRFCREWCPSGVYFAVLGPTSLTGVELAHPEACTDCGACTSVCPVDLEPRRLLDEGEVRRGLGFYPEGMTSQSLCLRCGDCVAACEATAARGGGGPVPLRLGWLRAELRGEKEAG